MRSSTDDGSRAGSGKWTEPTVEAVAPGVHRIPLPLPGDGLRAVNVYALVHGARVTLVDAGWSFGPGKTVLEAALSELDCDLASIDRVLVTHLHRDHYTLGIRLRKTLGTRVLIGAGEREGIEAIIAGRADGQRSWLTRWGAEQLRPSLEAEPRPSQHYELPDEWIEAPTELRVGERTLRAIPTPGHTRGHLVFLDEAAGLLFAGDHVLPRITPSIGVESPRTPLALADFLDSLQVVRDLPDLAVLPAHGALGRRSHQRIDELVEHHRRRLTATTAAVTAEGRTPYEVARALSWTSRDKDFADLDPHNRFLAVAETAAHLDVLVRDRVLVRTDIPTDDPTTDTHTYAPTPGGTRANRPQ
jgi:glyoxylase-like metal-dependent hydrolase (beta-lactamase superfamily II)